MGSGRKVFTPRGQNVGQGGPQPLMLAGDTDAASPCPSSPDSDLRPPKCKKLGRKVGRQAVSEGLGWEVPARTQKGRRRA